MTAKLTHTPTPKEMALAILDARAANPLVFRMADWFARQGGMDQGIEALTIAPDDDPNVCGTTMCIAGWGAHLTGHTLVRATGLATTYLYDSLARLGDGPLRSVPDVGREVFGLSPQMADWLFCTDDGTAVDWLYRVAGGEDPEKAAADLYAAEDDDFDDDPYGADDDY